jgi:hypothetical protein
MIIASTRTRRLHSVIAATLLMLAAASVSAQTQPPLDLRLHPLPDPLAGEHIATPAQQAVDSGTSVHGSFSTGIGYSKNYGNSTVNTAELDVSKQYESGRAIDLHIGVLHSTGLPTTAPHDYVSRYPRDCSRMTTDAASQSCD